MLIWLFLIRGIRIKIRKDKKDKKDKEDKDNKTYGDLYKNSNTFKQISRAAYIFVTGMCISLVTYLLFDDWYVKFGILHFYRYIYIVIIQVCG